MDCKFCQDNINRVDYKNTQFLRKYVTSQFKIATSKRNQLCNKHQRRRVAEAIKLARFMAIMPYTQESDGEIIIAPTPPISDLLPAPSVSFGQIIKLSSICLINFSIRLPRSFLKIRKSGVFRLKFIDIKQIIK